MRKSLAVAGLLLIALAVYAVWVRQQTPLPVPTPAPPAAPTPAPPPPPPVTRTLPDASPDLRPAAPISEAVLMQKIRDNVKSNPPLAESLAREGRRGFPDSPDSDERDALLVDALINQQRIGAARDETYYYMDHHPQGRFREHLFVMTGVHPTPRGR
jgi:hypothetical protein